MAAHPGPTANHPNRARMEKEPIAVNLKRITLAAAAIALAVGVAAGVAQPPPDSDEWAGLEPPSLYAADGPGAFGSPGGPGSRGARFAAFRGPSRPGVFAGRRLADYLDLTDSQRDSARKLFAGQRDKVRPIYEQQRELRGRLDDLLDDANASDASIGQLVKQLRANRESLKTARQGLHDQLASLLDANQKAKLEQLRSVMEDFRDGARRHRRG